MRNVARLKMGYYPLPEAEGVKLRSLLSFAGLAPVIDPCVGQGTALQVATSDAPVRRFGVSTGRMASSAFATRSEARRLRTISGSFTASASVGTSCMWQSCI